MYDGNITNNNDNDDDNDDDDKEQRKILLRHFPMVQWCFALQTSIVWDK